MILSLPVNAILIVLLFIFLFSPLSINAQPDLTSIDGSYACLGIKVGPPVTNCLAGATYSLYGYNLFATCQSNFPDSSVKINTITSLGVSYRATNGLCSTDSGSGIQSLSITLYSPIPNGFQSLSINNSLGVSVISNAIYIGINAESSSTGNSGSGVLTISKVSGCTDNSDGTTSWCYVDQSNPPQQTSSIITVTGSGFYCGMDSVDFTYYRISTSSSFPSDKTKTFLANGTMKVDGDSGSVKSDQLLNIQLPAAQIWQILNDASYPGDTQYYLQISCINTGLYSPSYKAYTTGTNDDTTLFAKYFALWISLIIIIFLLVAAGITTWIYCCYFRNRLAATNASDLNNDNPSQYINMKQATYS